MIQPIRLSFDVDCPADHAFEVWTTRIGQWWPADHTASGDADKGESWRDRNHGGWATLLPHFVRAAGAGSEQHEARP